MMVSYGVAQMFDGSKRFRNQHLQVRDIFLKEFSGRCHMFLKLNATAVKCGSMCVGVTTGSMNYMATYNAHPKQPYHETLQGFEVFLVVLSSRRKGTSVIVFYLFLARPITFLCSFFTLYLCFLLNDVSFVIFQYFALIESCSQCIRAKVEPQQHSSVSLNK